MRSILRYFTTFSLTALALMAALGGCTAIAEAVDCDQMCNQLQTCVDSDMDVGRCGNRCEAEVDNSKLRNQLDDCTDCLDNNYACAEIADACPVCQQVVDAVFE